MISESLLERVACPVCLEPEGCPACARPGAGHEACGQDYAARVRCACGGPDKRRLESAADALRCPCCGVAYPLRRDAGYLDLVPRTSVGEVTRYADHEFHERLHVTDAPPLLSARVKADMMRRMLAPEPTETVLDLGCGAGKFALFSAAGGGHAAGLDVAPFFLSRAVREVDLVLGDLRRLPFRRRAFPCAYSLDVLEHLDEEGVREVLVEARRTVGGNGRLFVYTHAMESSRLAGFQRAVNRLARRLGRAGWIDHEREALRKSDHRNAIRSHEHFEALCAQAGLRVAERRYYNVVFKAVVEDLLLRLYEQHRRRRAAKGAPLSHAGGHVTQAGDHSAHATGHAAQVDGHAAHAGGHGGQAGGHSTQAGSHAAHAGGHAAQAAGAASGSQCARASGHAAPAAGQAAGSGSLAAQPTGGADGAGPGADGVGEGPAPGRLTLALALVLTWFLKLDVVLFGGVRTGPFFGLLKPTRP